MIGISSKAQDDFIKGFVLEETEKGEFKPIAFANVYWKDTLIGVTTDSSGYFKLGIYRHRTIGYWNSNWESLPDQTVYYDNIVFRKPKKDEKIKNK